MYVPWYKICTTLIYYCFYFSPERMVLLLHNSSHRESEENINQNIQMFYYWIFGFTKHTNVLLLNIWLYKIYKYFITEYLALQNIRMFYYWIFGFTKYTNVLLLNIWLCKIYKCFITEYLALQNFRIPIFIFQDCHLCSVNDLDITLCAVTYVLS